MRNYVEVGGSLPNTRMTMKSKAVLVGNDGVPRKVVCELVQAMS